MRDYNYREKWHKLLTPEIVKKLTLIHEYKGEQRLFIEATIYAIFLCNYNLSFHCLITFYFSH